MTLYQHSQNGRIDFKPTSEVGRLESLVGSRQTLHELGKFMSSMIGMRKNPARGLGDLDKEKTSPEGEVFSLLFPSEDGNHISCC